MLEWVILIILWQQVFSMSLVTSLVLGNFIASLLQANYPSDDDYEPASVGPPSVASSIGGNAEAPGMGNENPIFGDQDIGGLGEPALPPSPGGKFKVV